MFIAGALLIFIPVILWAYDRIWHSRAEAKKPPIAKDVLVKFNVLHGVRLPEILNSVDSLMTMPLHHEPGKNFSCGIKKQWSSGGEQRIKYDADEFSFSGTHKCTLTNNSSHHLNNITIGAKVTFSVAVRQTYLHHGNNGAHYISGEKLPPREERLHLTDEILAPGEQTVFWVYSATKYNAEIEFADYAEVSIDGNEKRHRVRLIKNSSANRVFVSPYYGES